MSDLDLSTLDRDGALREAAAGLPRLDPPGLPHHRRHRGGRGAPRGPRPGRRGERAGEQRRQHPELRPHPRVLQDTFYTEAERKGALTGRRPGSPGRRRGRTGARRALRDLLGQEAVARPSSISKGDRVAGSIRPDCGRFRGSGYRRLQGPGRPHRVAESCWPRQPGSTRSRRGTRPGSGTSPAYDLRRQRSTWPSREGDPPVGRGHELRVRQPRTVANGTPEFTG